jgi:hypothetical protein
MKYGLLFWNYILTGHPKLVIASLTFHEFQGGSGRQVLSSEGAKSKVVELDENVYLGEKPLKKAIISAKITAYDCSLRIKHNDGGMKLM